MIRVSRWRKSHCRTNTSVRRKKEIQKSRTVIVREIQVGKCGSNLNYWLIDILTITDFLYFPQFLTQPNLNLQIGF